MMLKRVMEPVDALLRWALILLMGVSVINVLWQVFSRYALNDPSSWTEELSRYMLVWVGVLGAAYAVRKNIHLSIDLIFSETVPPRIRRLAQIVSNASIFLFAFFVMVVGGLRLVQLTLHLNQVSAALQVKLGYVYAIVPISGLLMMFYSAVFLLDIFSQNEAMTEKSAD